MWPIWLLALVFVPLLALTIWRMVVANRSRRVDWARRAAIVVCLVGIGLTPAIPSTQNGELVSNVEMYFVVDRTGSMAAEDYNGNEARLEGVKHDLIGLSQAIPGARYSIIGFDSQATGQLPLTTDTRAVKSWAETVTQEITQYSSGSAIDRPLGELTQTLNDAAERNPQDVRLVFFFSDGENTNGSNSSAGHTFDSFADLAPLIDGGAVLGYGTPEGGKMRSYDGSAKTGIGTDAPYIHDENGEPAISKIDETNLRTLASQLHVKYVHRIKPDSVDSLVKNVNASQIAADGRRDVTTYRDVYWPIGIVLVLLLAWEAWQLTREVPHSGRRHPSLDRRTGATSQTKQTRREEMGANR